MSGTSAATLWWWKGETEDNTDGLKMKIGKRGKKTWIFDNIFEPLNEPILKPCPFYTSCPMRRKLNKLSLSFMPFRIRVLPIIWIKSKNKKQGFLRILFLTHFPPSLPTSINVHLLLLKSSTTYLGRRKKTCPFLKHPKAATRLAAIWRPR